MMMVAIATDQTRHLAATSACWPVPEVVGATRPRRWLAADGRHTDVSSCAEGALVHHRALVLVFRHVHEPGRRGRGVGQVAEALRVQLQRQPLWHEVQMDRATRAPRDPCHVVCNQLDVGTAFRAVGGAGRHVLGDVSTGTIDAMALTAFADAGREQTRFMPCEST